MLLHTGCDAVLVARGTLGQPWIGEDIIAHLLGHPVEEKTLEIRRLALLKHYRQIAAYHPPRRVAVDMRRIGCWYVKRSAATKPFREAISHAESMEVVEDLILNFPIGCGAEGEDEEPCEDEC
jgi:tRNA-dihydrouridine synthase